MQEPDEWAKSRGFTVDTIGWCHHCSTFPFYGNRRSTATRRGLCVTPHCDHTWAFGIFDLTHDPDYADTRGEWARLAARQEQAEP